MNSNSPPGKGTALVMVTEPFWLLEKIGFPLASERLFTDNVRRLVPAASASKDKVAKVKLAACCEFNVAVLSNENSTRSTLPVLGVAEGPFKPVLARSS